MVSMHGKVLEEHTKLYTAHSVAMPSNSDGPHLPALQAACSAHMWRACRTEGWTNKHMQTVQSTKRGLS